MSRNNAAVREWMDQIQHSSEKSRKTSLKDLSHLDSARTKKNKTTNSSRTRKKEKEYDQIQNQLNILKEEKFDLAVKIAILEQEKKDYYQKQCETLSDCEELS
jgi:predicted  nucleic acid-binding Zn-ribbon protein